MISTAFLKSYREKIPQNVSSSRVSGGSWETFVFLELVWRCEFPAPGVLVMRGSQGAECRALGSSC